MSHYLGSGNQLTTRYAAVRWMYWWGLWENMSHYLGSGNQLTSNGNDIEAKRNDTSIIWVFLVSKRNKPTYSRTRSGAKRSEDYYFYSLQDRRNNEYI